MGFSSSSILLSPSLSPKITFHINYLHPSPYSGCIWGKLRLGLIQEETTKVREQVRNLPIFPPTGVQCASEGGLGQDGATHRVVVRLQVVMDKKHPRLFLHYSPSSSPRPAPGQMGPIGYPPPPASCQLTTTENSLRGAPSLKKNRIQFSVPSEDT